MTWEYSEDNLIEQTVIDLFYQQLSWDTIIAYNKERFGVREISWGVTCLRKQPS